MERSPRRISRIISMDERLAKDPRGIKRYTNIGGLSFEVVEVPTSEQKIGSVQGNTLDNDIFEREIEEEGE